MVQCALGVSHRALKQPEKYFCEPGSRALMLKAIFSTFGSWIIAASNLPEKTLVHFSLHDNNHFGPTFEFS